MTDAEAVARLSTLNCTPWTKAASELILQAIRKVNIETSLDRINECPDGDLHFYWFGSELCEDKSHKLFGFIYCEADGGIGYVLSDRETAALVVKDLTDANVDTVCDVLKNIDAFVRG